MSGAGRSASLDLLKWLAIVTMVADHLRFLWPEQHWLFVVGRLAFPFFCLAIAANVGRSACTGAVFAPSNVRYLGWMLVFSVVSEWPYRWLDNGSLTFNVMPTLTLGLLVAWGVHYQTRVAGLIALLAVGVAVLGHAALMYGLPGVLLPAALLVALRSGRGGWWLAGLLALAGNLTNDWILHNALQPIALAVLLTAFLSVPFGVQLLRRDLRVKVRPVGRWGYGFYPLHLVAIKLIGMAGHALG